LLSSADRELLAAEDAGWGELHALIDSLTVDEAERPGYYREGWSAKDALAHIGSWLAVAGALLQQIREGTYRAEEINIDELNGRFYETLKDVPLDSIRAQAETARARMLQAWSQLPELTPDAVSWIRKAGAEHYWQHLPRLREWIAEVRSR
ncbi:MAG TPA: maleylpyruvate isomerase N-terminal domain-containing protein, partial [Actinomycetota bacterium]|nr:maleylpyruvate isomerase N-terminal domain-containing protein [Actinomycetota bacterium]